MSASERRKGAVAEREVCAILRENGWPQAARSADGRSQQTRGDVAHGPAGVHIEIKRHERLSVPRAFDQVLRDARPQDIAVVIHRPSRHEWMATTRLIDLLPLLAQRGDA